MLTLGSPNWVEQGPGPITQGQVEQLDSQSNPVAGAVEAIAAHPTNANIAVIATVNGGIWTTNNATSASPTWTPRTDGFASLSFGAIAYSPVNSNVLYAGTGSFSSGGGAGGPAIGVLKSTDGGATWAEVGGTALDGFRINSVLPTTLGGGNVVLVGAQGGGVFRSADGGASFAQISGGGSGLPAFQTCFSIVADGADSNIFFAAIGINSLEQGVYRSNDGGLTWTNASTGIGGLGGDAVRIELAAHFDVSDNSRALYAAVIAQADGELSGVFRSIDRGVSWTSMDLVRTNEAGGSVGLHPSGRPIGSGAPEDPGGQGSIHFSILADRSSEFIVYVGGDRQPGQNEAAGDFSFPNSIGANNFSGRHFRGNAAAAAGSQWFAINAEGVAGNPNDGASGTSPHADSRYMTFDANGNILEGDDGGIYRLSNPNSVSRAWSSAIGNLRVSEFYSVAYDSVNNVVTGGTQDVGTPRQDLAGNFSWTELQQGDGGVVQVDTTSSPGNAIVYTTFQVLGGFNRRTFNSSNVQVNFENVGLVVNGTGGQVLRQVDSTVQFIQPYVLNAVDPTRMLLGTTIIYESFDQGDTLFRPLGTTNVGFVSAMAYGGRLSGSNFPDVAWVGSNDFSAPLRLRTTGGGAFNVLAAYPGSTPRDIALDPDNWQRAYVVDSVGRVWRTTNAGSSFTEITNNLAGLSNDLRAIEIFSPTTAADVGDAIFVAGLGGVFGTDDPELGASATWVEFGVGLPNYLVRDMSYNQADDLLLVGGFGRGAWTVPDLSDFVIDGGTTVSVAVAPAATAEDGATNLVYTFTRTGSTAAALTVNFNVAGSATLNTDYAATSSNAPFTYSATTGTVTFAAGSTTAAVAVNPTTDTDVEADETNTLTVSAGAGYTVGSPSAATGTISNDDSAAATAVSVTVSPASVTEDGAVNLAYTFTRTGSTALPLTANFSVGGSATAGDDYVATGAAAFGATAGVVTFAAGASTAVVTLNPNADGTVEGNETAILTVAAALASGATAEIEPNNDLATAQNADLLNWSTAFDPNIGDASTNTSSTIPHVSLLGAGDGTFDYFRFTVANAGDRGIFDIDGANFDTEIFLYDVLGNPLAGDDDSLITEGAGGSTSDLDSFLEFTFPTPGVFIIGVGKFDSLGSAGGITGLAPAPGDDYELHISVEDHALAQYSVGSPSVATGTINNDDVLTTVTLAVSPAVVLEDGAQNLAYTFTRTGSTVGPLTVSFSVAGSAAFSGDYAQAGADAFSTSAGTVTFAAGASTAVVTLDPSVDGALEGNETAELTLVAGAGYVVGSPSAATGTIDNDDAEVTVAVFPTSVLEDGLQTLAYTFTRVGATAGPLTVNFNVSGSATFIADYTQAGADTFSATAGTVSFAAGATTAVVTLDPKVDTAVEGNESAVLTVAAGAGYTAGSPSAATGAIDNDDTEVTVAVAPTSVLEDGPLNLDFTFTRTGLVSGPLTVRFSVSGTATFNADYTASGATTFSATSGTVTFAPGVATAVVTLNPTADGTSEAAESVVLTITPANTGTGDAAEVEPNDSLVGAQDMNAAIWSLNFDPDIGDAAANTSTVIPHLSISGSGNNSFDYYSLTIDGGVRGILDIDGANFDSQIFVYDSLGTLLAQNDDSDATAGAGGSVSGLDSFLDLTTPGPGTYIVAVGRFPSTGDPGGVTGAPLLAGDTYTLHVSLENQPIVGYSIGTPSVATSTITDDDAVGVDLRVTAADLPDPAVAGSGVGNLVYTVLVENVGFAGATGVALNFSNLIPAGVSFVSAIGAGSNTLNGAGTDTWTIGNLAAGATATLTITYTVGGGATHGTVVSVSANGLAANQALVNTGDDSASASTAITATDFGDAPEPQFDTLLASDGARHLATGARFGNTRDAEPDGQPSATVTGDDAAGLSDEDGLVSQTAIFAGAPGSITLNVQGVTGTNFINAWIDFNRDGDWEDAGEKIGTDVLVTANGIQVLNFVAPASVVAGITLSRFRLSTAAGLTLVGAAPDGEVEDHSLTQVAAGFITTNVVNGQLIVTGDDGFNGLDIVLGDFGLVKNKVTLTGQGGTLVDGSAAVKEFFNITNGMIVQLRGGNDAVTVNGSGVAGNISLEGEAGNDRYLIGALKTKFVFADSGGVDTLDFSGQAKGVKIDLAKLHTQKQSFGSGNSAFISGIENVIGSPGNDTIKGNDAANVLLGNGGKDTLDGRAGDDLLRGGEGNDKLIGGLGNDILVGEGGNDTLSASGGFDLLIGGFGADKLNAGKTGDTLLIGGATLHDNNDVALLALLGEWSRFFESVVNRADDLRSGGGVNGDLLLSSGVTVLDDGVKDTLKSVFGNNWIFLPFSDKLSGRKGTDLVDL